MDEKTLNELSEYLFYEIEMLNISVVKANNAMRKKIISKYTNHKGIINAQIELNLALDSFAIHYRNLFNFFVGKRRDRGNYVLAEHYLDRDKMKEFKEMIEKRRKSLNHFSDKVNNQVAHLTFDRIGPKFTGTNKSWDLQKIHEFNEIIKYFLELVDDNKLCTKLNEWKNQEYPHRTYVRKYIEG